jgi:hypothetical protein
MKKTNMPRKFLTKIVIFFGLFVLSMNIPGCAFGDRHVTWDYRPVMNIKAFSPIRVQLCQFQSSRGLSDERKIGQLRNGFHMVTAKVLCEEGNAPEWVRRALAAELTHAGFEIVNPPLAVSKDDDVVITGTMNEFLTDISLQFTTYIRVTLVVTKRGQVNLTKEFSVEEGGASLTASSSEYQRLTTAALTKLMRRAVSEVIAAIEN